MDTALLMAKKKSTGPALVTFLGEVTSANFITYANLCTAVGLANGSLREDAGWLKYLMDGKVTYLSKTTVRSNMTYNHLYARGIVFGMTGSGIYAPAATGPVDQHRTITVGDKQYLVKCPTAKDLNPDPSNVMTNGEPYSEFSRLVYPVVVDSSDTTLNTIYKGPKIASYNLVQLGISSSGAGGWTISSTSILTNGNPRPYCVGIQGSAAKGGNHTETNAYAFVGWRALLIEQ